MKVSINFDLYSFISLDVLGLVAAFIGLLSAAAVHGLLQRSQKAMSGVEAMAKFFGTGAFLLPVFVSQVVAWSASAWFSSYPQTHVLGVCLAIDWLCALIVTLVVA